MASPIELLLLAQSFVPATQTLYISTGPTLINSSTDAAVNNLAAAVTSGTTYAISALVPYVTASGGGNPVFTFHGPAVSLGILAADFLASNAGTVGSARVLNGSIGSTATGPTMAASDTCAYRATGLATFSASGTLSLQAHTTVGADTFTCQIGGYISVTPVTL